MIVKIKIALFLLQLLRLVFRKYLKKGDFPVLRGILEGLKNELNDL